MGTYNYFITTKAKKVLIDGVMEEVFSARYAYKETSGPIPARINATEARIENAWARRSDGPRYLILGEDYDEGTYVYTDVPENFPVCVSDGYFHNRLRVAGRLVKSGNKLVMRAFHTMLVETKRGQFVDTVGDETVGSAIDRIRTLVPGMYVRHRNSMGLLEISSPDMSNISIAAIAGFSGRVVTKGRSPQDMKNEQKAF